MGINLAGVNLTPQPDARVERNIQRMREAGMGDEDIARYRAYEDSVSRTAAPESQSPQIPGFAAESTAQLPQQPTAERQRAPSATASGKRGNIMGPLVQTATGGLSDELGGVIGAIFQRDSYRSPSNFAANYRSSRDDIRQQDAAYNSDHPIRAAAAGLAGAVLPVVGSGGLGALTSAGRAAASAPSLARMAAEAAALGAGTGAASANGPMRDRMVGGAVGGMAGGLLGAVPGVAGKATALLRNPAPAQALSRADELILNAATRDGLSIDDLLRIATTQQKNATRGVAKPATLMDVAGENVRGLARAAQSVPSTAKQKIVTALEDRQQGQMGRIMSDLERTIGRGADDAVETAEEIVQRRREMAAPLYEAAYSKGAVELPEVEQALAEVPAFRAAFDRGKRIAEMEGKPLPKVTKIIRGERGKWQKAEVEVPGVQALDYMKRGLDDLIEGRMRSGKMGKQEARVLRDRLKSVLEKVDEAVPEYAQARAYYSGESALMDALDQGRQILKGDFRLTRKAIEAMSDGEQEMFRVGAMDAIREAMQHTADGRDLVKVIFGSPEKKAIARTIFPKGKEGSAAFSRFQRELERESQMFETRTKVTGGSPTARIQAEQADMAGLNPGEVAGAMVDVGTGNVSGLTRRALSTGLAARARGVRGNVADAIGDRMLLQPSSPEFTDWTSVLRQLLEDQNQRGAKRALAGRAVGSGAGLTAGHLMNRTSQP